MKSNSSFGMKHSAIQISASNHNPPRLPHSGASSLLSSFSEDDTLSLQPTFFVSFGPLYFLLTLAAQCPSYPKIISPLTQNFPIYYVPYNKNILSYYVERPWRSG